MNTHTHVSMECPACGHVLTAASNITGECAPKPCDVSICVHCAQYLMFDSEPPLRIMTDREFEALGDTQQAMLLSVRRLIRERRPLQ